MRPAGISAQFRGRYVANPGTVEWMCDGIEPERGKPPLTRSGTSASPQGSYVGLSVRFSVAMGSSVG